MPHIHHDEQDTTVQNTVEEEQPVPETTTEDESTDNAQGEDTSELNEGARASLGLDDAPHITTTHSKGYATECVSVRVGATQVKGVKPGRL